MPRGGAWPAPTSLTAPGIDGFSPSIAVNARGDAAVVYVVTPYAGTNMPNVAQFVSRSGPTGGWTPPVSVSETIDPTVGYVQNPQVGLDGNGLATVIYMGFGLEANRQLGAMTWTGPRRVIGSAVPGASFLSPDLAVDGRGNG